MRCIVGGGDLDAPYNRETEKCSIFRRAVVVAGPYIAFSNCPINCNLHFHLPGFFLFIIFSSLRNQNYVV